MGLEFFFEVAQKVGLGFCMMKRKPFTEEQIITILKGSEAGAKNQDICRKHGITEQTFYRCGRSTVACKYRKRRD